MVVPQIRQFCNNNNRYNLQLLLQTYDHYSKVKYQGNNISTMLVLILPLLPTHMKKSPQVFKRYLSNTASARTNL